MISPLDYRLDDFFPKSDSMSQRDLWRYNSLASEDLHGATLVDNLILLRFVDLSDIQEVLRAKYQVPFFWLNFDPTPAELKDMASRYNVLLQRETDRMIVYVQLGQELDDASLLVDIPNYKMQYVFIADCNYRIVTTGAMMDVLSYQLADFRPLLVLRRLLIDCDECGGTDLHFLSTYRNKVPHHTIQYRVKRELVNSEFSMDLDMMQRVTQAAVAKLSSASASDLDSTLGVTTDIPNVFGDGTTDVRLTGMRAQAGFYAVMAMQTVTTTNLTVDELGFPKADVAIIRDIARRRTGLTLVTGEMRSGKNTTIFAMVNEIIHLPIRIIEYSNPVENRMDMVQTNYKGDIDNLKNYLRLAKKQDIDIAILNEIPNAEVAFAVRDLVNSAIGVITTTHIDRVWHVPNKLSEFFGKDYKTIISQLNAVINQKMFRRWSAPNMQKRVLPQGPGEFEKFAYRCGVRQYFVPTDAKRVKYSLQPLTEILVLTDEQKTAMLNFEELWRAEQMIRNHIERTHGTIENKLASYINEGICSLDELRRLF